MSNRSILSALRAVFPRTLPILAGFWFIGLAYGLYMHSLGFGPLYPALTSLCIFAGSMEFICATLLLGGFHPLQALLLTLVVNARHLFYAISMLAPYAGTGWKKPYLVFGLCDETFSINFTADVPDGVDRAWFHFFVTLLDHLYWVLGATLGGLCGEFLPFRTKGIEFVLPAMFIVIFLEQFRKEKRHLHAWIGLGASLLCLVIFGPGNFVLPALGAILLLLFALRGTLERRDA